MIATVDPRSVQARRERTLRDELDVDFGVRKGLEQLQEWQHGRGFGYRRQLLSRALRLTRSMSPEIAEIISDCKTLLGFDSPIEVYVRPQLEFNASCYREAHGPTILTLSSRLLECFTPGELRFVIGHELGHAALEHFGLPMPILATMKQMGIPFVERLTALKLYAWSRHAEISADRIGLLCAGDPEAATSGFFKLASGMASDRVKPDIEAFAQQIDSLAAAPEAREKPRDDDDTLDCFSTHPYNPVRVRAVWAFSRSVPYLEAMGRDTAGAMTLEAVETLIERDMRLMEPTYLQEQSAHSDVLRRLLYTAGVAVAAADGAVEASELDAIGKLLGNEHASDPGDVEHALKNLEGRIEAALDAPFESRAQVIQHLVIVAAADGDVADSELEVMERIAGKLGVDRRLIHETAHGAMHPLD